MKKNFITLLIFTLIATPCFAKNVAPNPNSAHQKPIVTQRPLESPRIAPHRRIVKHHPPRHAQTVVVDYNCAGVPFRVTQFGYGSFSYNRFYL